MSIAPVRILLAVAAMGAAHRERPASACGVEAAAPRHLEVRAAAMPTLADIFALNRQLAARGRPALPHSLATYGPEIVAQRGRLVVDADMDLVMPRSVRNAAYTLGTGGTLDEGAVGVALVCTPGWSVYPLAGIGATRLDLDAGPRTAPGVDTVLAGGTAGGALSSRTLFDDYGLGVDYRASGGAARLSAGLRVGYVERFGRARWTLAGEPVSGGPKYGLSGPYVRAAVGVGF